MNSHTNARSHSSCITWITSHRDTKATRNLKSGEVLGGIELHKSLGFEISLACLINSTRAPVPLQIRSHPASICAYQETRLKSLISRPVTRTFHPWFNEAALKPRYKSILWSKLLRSDPRQWDESPPPVAKPGAWVRLETHKHCDSLCEFHSWQCSCFLTSAMDRGLGKPKVPGLDGNA